MIRLRPALLALLLPVTLALECEEPVAGAPVCAFHNPDQRCVYDATYDPAAYGTDWTVLVTDDRASCIEACDGLGYLRTVRTGVIVDESSYTVTDAEIASDLAFASDWLFSLTGTTMSLHGIRRVATTPTDFAAAIEAYASSDPATPPHFVMVLAADPVAVTYGGYAISSPPIAGFCNDFASPTGQNRVYGTVIDWTHRFSPCGYDLDRYHDTQEWVSVSATSLDDGTCRATSGVACVANPLVGYDVCSTLDPALPYLQHPRAFAHGTFIHEIMHSFGTNGNLDHFGTEVCDASMGGEDYGARDSATFQHFCGMCPNVYDQFVQSFRPCP